MEFMETGLYEIKFKDGRIFRIFTANKKQKDRLLKKFREQGTNNTLINLLNGIHTVKQFENIMNAANPIQKI